MEGIFLILFYCAFFFFFAVESSRTEAISEYTGLHPKISSNYPFIYIFVVLPFIMVCLHSLYFKTPLRPDVKIISCLYLLFIFLLILCDKYGYKLFCLYYKKTISRDDFISKIKANTFQFLTEENRRLTFLEISKETLKLYKNKLRRNLITEEIFFNMVNENIDLHLKYFYNYNYAFNQILQYSLENNKVYTVEQIEKLYTIIIPKEYIKNNEII